MGGPVLDPGDIALETDNILYITFYFRQINEKTNAKMEVFTDQGFSLHWPSGKEGKGSLDIA